MAWEHSVNSNATAETWPRENPKLGNQRHSLPLTLMPRDIISTPETMGQLVIHQMLLERFQPVGRAIWLVNPANRHLSNLRGAARAVAEMAGSDYQDHCTQYAQALGGRLADGSIYQSPAYGLGRRGYTGIFNVVLTDCEPNANLADQQVWLSRYYRTVFSKALEMEVETLVMTLFGTGTFHYNVQVSMTCFLNELEKAIGPGTQYPRAFKVHLLVPEREMSDAMRREQLRVSTLNPCVAPRGDLAQGDILQNAMLQSEMLQSEQHIRGWSEEYLRPISAEYASTGAPGPPLTGARPGTPGPNAAFMTEL